LCGGFYQSSVIFARRCITNESRLGKGSAPARRGKSVDRARIEVSRRNRKKAAARVTLSVCLPRTPDVQGILISHSFSSLIVIRCAGKRNSLVANAVQNFLCCQLNVAHALFCIFPTEISESQFYLRVKIFISYETN
jgi:hypothetical protein